MYARIFCNASHTRRLSVINNRDSSGWEVREEQDSRIVRSVRYDDWHRVERALLQFAREAADLQDAGWVEA
jgi:hypothetical protein